MCQRVNLVLKIAVSNVSCVFRLLLWRTQKYFNSHNFVAPLSVYIPITFLDNLLSLIQSYLEKKIGHRLLFIRD